MDGTRAGRDGLVWAERRLAARLAEMNRPAALPYPAPVATALLARLFPREGGVRPDWQKIAAATALLRRLCIVSGGPGTGKTTTVVKVLALLLCLHPALRVALAAPTGKAAARLQGSLRDQLTGAWHCRRREAALSYISRTSVVAAGHSRPAACPSTRPQSP